MKNKRLQIKLAAAGIALGLGMSTAPAMAETNRALEAWKAFAAEENNPRYDKWVELLSDPEAIKLAKEWKALRGYDAYDLFDKEEIPAELKPGLIITAENKADFPWLPKYLTQETYDAIGAPWGNIRKIKIVPSNTYYLHKGYLKGNKAMAEQNTKLTFDETGQPIYEDGSYALLSGPAATALPFLVNPKNGLELHWNNVAASVATDTLEFDSAYLNSCTPDSKADRQYRANFWWWHYHERHNTAPFGDIEGKGDMVEGGALFMFEPNDVRGLAGVRQRYASGTKEDDFKIFLPSLRRTRLLTGTDSQDPLASGLELSWDDWRGNWIKTNIENFEYNLVGEALILSPTNTMHSTGGLEAFTIDEERCGVDYVEMELRPTYILEQVDKTGKYQYSKLRYYYDKEDYSIATRKTWDPRGNLFRSYVDARDFLPATGVSVWGALIIRNSVSHRTSTMWMNSTWENLDEIVDESMFDVDQLRDYQ
ncbi:outer membrane lipoprotein-sorting protein [Cycloclasticus sp. P1]|uniref:outer membrane lipoprotein-sorting protein n=1 Tax=Cycloclasticus sp. (strain P1) TaxID=385025 RepID=UPI000286B03C|nr:outer membrane lipoprotein-sorting protein [Cycloclasticus sp. P1]AFT68270.1 hypothetical protein Q91_2237 [Cycloclasticus sp. P1]